MSEFAAVFAAGFILAYFAVLIISMAVAVVTLIAQYRLFEKAGEAGWKCIIPYYNAFVYSKIVTGNYTYAIVSVVAAVVYSFFCFLFGLTEMTAMFVIAMLVLVPVIVLSAWFAYKTGKAYGKSTGFCVAMIFLTPFLTIAMGFDKDTVYTGPLAEQQEETYY